MLFIKKMMLLVVLSLLLMIVNTVYSFKPTIYNNINSNSNSNSNNIINNNNNLISSKSSSSSSFFPFDATSIDTFDTSYSSQYKKVTPIKSLVITLPYAKVYDDDTITNALNNMNTHNTGSVMVFTRDEQAAGIFTERDFVRKVLDQPSSESMVISQVMTPRDKLIIADSKLSIEDCRKLMLLNKIRHLPVIENDKILGIISMREIMRALQNEDSAALFGQNLAEVQEKSKELANQLALESGVEGSKQDLLRTGFVLAGASVIAFLYQGNWVHDHEVISMSATFALGYVGIIFENYFEFNKAAIALLMCTALWVIFAGTAGATGIPIQTALGDLSEKVSEVSEVVFFLMGAMTIVEIVDAHKGFKVVTDSINSEGKKSLMWVVGFITFFMSAILDNLTTTIVMVSLIKKILPDVDDRKLFGAMIVIAANAGGAWTPIGDVTTTMLWINGQISAIPTILGLFLPSIVSTVISIGILQSQIPEGSLVPPKSTENSELAPRGKLVFATGLLGLLSVPVFKALTGLPPYLGMLSALGVMWTLTDAIHAGEGKDREELMAPAALKKIDTSGVLFFLGILLSVGALDSAGILRSLAQFLDTNIPNDDIVATIIGIASAIIDNVPLVAATMGMYPLDKIPMDDQLWQLIAFCAGTGGSIFVIGSAAGVALMGLEKVDFVWYAKRISIAALAGYFGGIATYLAQHEIMNFL